MDNSLDLYHNLLERLESLSRCILERKLRTVQELWQFEFDLLKFQLEQQRAMNAEKKHRREINARLKEVCRAKQAGWEVQRQQCQNELEQNKLRVNIYSHAFDLARKLGDTLAWIFLDRLQITSRTRDSSMPSSDVHRIPEGHGLQGMLAIAEILGNAGAGLPILHDITNCLRIGDLTFFRPNGSPLTIEVKTKFKGYQGDKMALVVKVHSVGTSIEDAQWDALYAHIPTKEIVVPQDIDEYEAVQASQLMEEELRRQLERMERITVWQSAEDGKLFQLGERTVGITDRLVPEVNMQHYDILQELVHDAKAQGFAWRAVDDAFVYTAFYKDTPLWLLENQQIIPEQSIPGYQEANFSIAFPEPEKEKNIVLVYNIFKNPPFVRPFFTYPLPAEAIIDLMWQRMQVYVTINLGKLVAALQSANLHSRLPKNKQEQDELFIPVSVEIPLPNGHTIYGRIVGLQYYVAQLIHEFISLEGFVSLISHMAEVTAEQAKKQEVYDKIFSRES